jgi:hypothetical protein
MTGLDIRPVALEPPATVAKPAARHHRNWWRWLAASAVFVPGGGLAYDLLSPRHRAAAPPEKRLTRVAPERSILD